MLVQKAWSFIMAPGLRRLLIQKNPANWFFGCFHLLVWSLQKMSASTFPQKEVGEFYNPNFINVKIDMEKGDGLMLAGKYSVNAYPTLLYIDGEGKLVHKVIGYMDPEKFISAGKVALKKTIRQPYMPRSMIVANEILLRYIIMCGHLTSLVNPVWK